MTSDTNKRALGKAFDGCEITSKFNSFNWRKYPMETPSLFPLPWKTSDIMNINNARSLRYYFVYYLLQSLYYRNSV